MRITGIACIIIGFICLAYSCTLSPFKRTEEFHEKVNQLIVSDKYSYETKNEQAQKFYKIRKEYGTYKFTFEDYGMTFILIGGCILLFMFNGWKSFRNSNKMIVIFVGVLAAFLSLAAVWVELLLDDYREQSPPWYETRGIVEILFLLCIILSVWLAVHISVILSSFKPYQYIHEIRLKEINYSYLLLLISTLIISAIAIAYGNYWFLAPGLLWSYFYVSIIAGRRVA